MSKNIVRLLTLGDSGAGKSSLLLRFTQNEFTLEYMPTIGIDFRLKTAVVDGKDVKVQVWYAWASSASASFEAANHGSLLLRSRTARCRRLIRTSCWVQSAFVLRRTGTRRDRSVFELSLTTTTGEHTESRSSMT